MKSLYYYLYLYFQEGGGEFCILEGGRKKYFVISLRFWMFDRDSIKSLMRLLTGWWKDVFWDELNVMWFCGTIE